MSERKVQVGDRLVYREGRLVFEDSGEVAAPPPETAVMISSTDFETVARLSLPRETSLVLKPTDGGEVYAVALEHPSVPVAGLASATLEVRRLPMYYTRVATEPQSLEQPAAFAQPDPGDPLFRRFLKDLERNGFRSSKRH